MNRIVPAVWVALAIIGAVNTFADDIDAIRAYQQGRDLYLHVMVDLGDTALDAPLCIVGDTCAPPFLSPSAYDRLQQFTSDGDEVRASGVFKAVFSAVLQSSEFDHYNLALLISNAQSDAGEGVAGSSEGSMEESIAGGLGGGTILLGYRSLHAARDEFVSRLESLPEVSGQPLQPRETSLEWLHYIRGDSVLRGTHTHGNFGMDQPVPDYDAFIIEDGEYISPFAGSSGCPFLYGVEFLLDGPTPDSDLDAQLSADLNGWQSGGYVELKEYLHDPQVELLPELPSASALKYSWIVTSQARAASVELAHASGVDQVFNVDKPLALERELREALRGIGAVSGALVAPTFVNHALRPEQVLPEVYFPAYLARSTSHWRGNLKKFQLRHLSDIADDTSADGSSVDQQGTAPLLATDANDEPAFSAGGEEIDSDLTLGAVGQLRFHALSFWTDPSALPPGADVRVPIGADGPLVDRGGAGQKIDGFAAYLDSDNLPVAHFIGETNTDEKKQGFEARQVFYEQAGAATLKPLNATLSTLQQIRTLLDPSAEFTDSELLDVIRWARGQDIEHQSPAARPWLLGDILHSQPLAINYGATPGYSVQNPNIRLFFGAGDGQFHILENTDVDGRQSGRELFTFFPQEQLGLLPQRIAKETERHLYGVDGSPVALLRDKNGDGTIDHLAGDTAYVYFGMRRGGTSYYALDVSDATAVPRVLWKISPDIDEDFHELGMTFSTPVVGKVNFSGTSVDALMFAGGYHGGWSDDGGSRIGKDASAADDPRGNAVYIVDAKTGDLIWKAVHGSAGNHSNTHFAHPRLVDSIPATLTPMMLPDGTVHRLYVGDTGGAVWRVDLPPASIGGTNHRRDHWFISLLADLGADAAEPQGSAIDDRRFFHAADVVRAYDSGGAFDGVLISSGNRADVLNTIAADFLFYLKDRYIDTGSAQLRAKVEESPATSTTVFADLADQTSCELGSEEVNSTAGSVPCGSLAFESGWKVRFSSAGEKGFSAPLTDAGRVFLTTFVPPSSAQCPPEQGVGRLSVLKLHNGTAAANGTRQYSLLSGMPASPKRVGDYIYLPGGGAEIYDLDHDGQKDHSNFIPTRATKTYSIYWREPGIDPL